MFITTFHAIFVGIRQYLTPFLKTLIMQLPRAFRCNESHQLPEAT